MGCGPLAVSLMLKTSGAQSGSALIAARSASRGGISIAPSPGSRRAVHAFGHRVAFGFGGGIAELDGSDELAGDLPQPFVVGAAGLSLPVPSVYEDAAVSWSAVSTICQAVSNAGNRSPRQKFNRHIHAEILSGTATLLCSEPPLP